MKVEDRNFNLLHENIKILQNKLSQKMKSSNLLWKFNRQYLILYQQEEMTKLSQINNNNIDNNNSNNNNNLNNC